MAVTITSEQYQSIIERLDKLESLLDAAPDVEDADTDSDSDEVRGGVALHRATGTRRSYHLMLLFSFF